MSSRVNAGGVEYNFYANTREFNAAVDRAKQNISQLSTTGASSVAAVGKGFDNVTAGAAQTAKTIAGLATSFAGLASVLSLGSFAVFAAFAASQVKDMLEMDRVAKLAALSIGDLSNKLNQTRLSGLNNEEFQKGIRGVAELLNEARNSENSLTELLEGNNLKYRDRKGEVIGVNDALERARGLIYNAATELDKVEIAKALGLSEEWVKVLDKSPVAFRAAQDAAKEVGASIDADLIAKAQQFNDWWSSTWTSFRANAVSAISYVANALSSLKMPDVVPLVNGKQEFNRGRFQIEDDTAKNLALRQALSPKPIKLTASPTQLKETGGGGGSRVGGGGGGGRSEADMARDRVENYTKSLERNNAVMKAEVENYNASNAVKKTAMEIAKAMPDLNKVDAKSREELIQKLKQETEAGEGLRVKLEQLNSLKEAARSLGDTFAGAFEDMALSGAKLNDVLKNLGKSLASNVLRGALSGSGSFSGAFGTKESGGLFGSLFKGLIGGGGSTTNNVTQNISANGDATVAKIAGAATMQGIGAWQKNVFPSYLQDFGTRGGN